MSVPVDLLRCWYVVNEIGKYANACRHRGYLTKPEADKLATEGSQRGRPVVRLAYDELRNIYATSYR